MVEFIEETGDVIEPVGADAWEGQNSFHWQLGWHHRYLWFGWRIAGPGFFHHQFTVPGNMVHHRGGTGHLHVVSHKASWHPLRRRLRPGVRIADFIDHYHIGLRIGGSLQLSLEAFWTIFSTNSSAMDSIARIRLTAVQRCPVLRCACDSKGGSPFQVRVFHDD